MKKLFIILILAMMQQVSFSQYIFTNTKDNQCTEVKSQDKTGTCWSYSTISFLESELIRMGKPKLDLSEMYIVRAIYVDKAQNYLLRQGKANFGQGSLSHDVMRAYKMVGAVPESAYSGLTEARIQHNHSRLERDLKTYLDGLITKGEVPEDWRDKVNEMLDENLGPVPSSFEYAGKTLTAETFTKTLGLNPDNYITLTSFTHHPFYSSFILEIPDNYSNGFYYNVPLDDLVRVTDNAINTGNTVAWDADVSEPFFMFKPGIAFVPKDSIAMDSIFKETIESGRFYEEVSVDQELRQQEFENFHTTDDHLMHIVGTSKNNEGKTFYRTKNSWGTSNFYEGFVYVSPAYFRLKTIAIMVHKDAIPADLKTKLGL